jgi:hypothetical protein
MRRERTRWLIAGLLTAELWLGACGGQSPAGSGDGGTSMDTDARDAPDDLSADDVGFVEPVIDSGNANDALLDSGLDSSDAEASAPCPPPVKNPDGSIVPPPRPCDAGDAGIPPPP